MSLSTKPSKVEIFNKSLKEFYEDLLVSHYNKDIKDLVSYNKDDVKKFYNYIKSNETTFFDKFYLYDEFFLDFCFGLELDYKYSFPYVSRLYLVATSVVEKQRLKDVSKLVKQSHERLEKEREGETKQLEKISDNIISSIASSSTPEETGGLGLLVSEVLNSVKQETGGKDLSCLDISPADIIGSISSKNTNDSLKNKTGIDFGSMITKISSQIEQKISKGEINVKSLQGFMK
jgi:hypothetical protein